MKAHESMQFGELLHTETLYEKWGKKIFYGSVVISVNENNCWFQIIKNQQAHDWECCKYNLGYMGTTQKWISFIRLPAIWHRQFPLPETSTRAINNAKMCCLYCFRKGVLGTYDETGARMYLTCVLCHKELRRTRVTVHIIKSNVGTLNSVYI